MQGYYNHLNMAEWQLCQRGKCSETGQGMAKGREGKGREDKEMKEIGMIKERILKEEWREEKREIFLSL